MKKSAFRNGTYKWFQLYEDRLLLKKLGYTTDSREIRCDEFYWLDAVNTAINKAQNALEALSKKKGK